MLVPIFQATRCHIPDDHSIKFLCSRNFETCTGINSFFFYIVLTNDTFWTAQEFTIYLNLLISLFICIHYITSSLDNGEQILGWKRLCMEDAEQIDGELYR
jgi:hypothetical protein